MSARQWLCVMQFCASHLLAAHLAVRCVLHLIIRRLAQLQTHAVDGMQKSTQQAQQAQLLPHTQPAVQPAGETLVLGSSAELHGSRQQT